MKMCLIYLLCLMCLIIYGCSTNNATPQASNSTTTPISTITPTTTATPEAEAPIATLYPTRTAGPSPDPCEGATDVGARDKFTFEQIVPCLNTPQKLLAFMQNDLSHGGDDWDNIQYGGNAYAPASIVYQKGVDDCDGLAEFGACVLAMNGYEAYSVGISINSQIGHNVTGFVTTDGIYAIDNGQIIDGPFSSWEALAQFYIDAGKAEPNQVIWLFYPCKLSEVTLVYTVPDLERMPHRVIR